MQRSQINSPAELTGLNSGAVCASHRGERGMMVSYLGLLSDNTNIKIRVYHKVYFQMSQITSVTDFDNFYLFIKYK